MVDSRHTSRHFIVGVIIVSLGVILLLDQLGFVEANKVFLFWPLILIYFGVNKLLNRTDMVGRFWGGFLTLLGISFQLEELGFERIRFATVWPVFLICLGVLLILQRYERRYNWQDSSAPPPFPGPPPGPAPGTIPGPGPGPGPAPEPEPSHASNPGPTPGRADTPRWGSPPGGPARPYSNFANDFRRDYRWDWPGHQGGWVDSSESWLSIVNILWGGRRRITSKTFRGGEIVSILGGFDIDLTQADIEGSEATIEVVTLFGGGNIHVPTSWSVFLENVGILGGCTDRTRHPEQPIGAPASNTPSTPPTRRLIIKGVSIFGGLNVKN